jgi:two-component system CheB/CheR fusion protein
MKETDINNILKDVVSLLSLQFKDSKIRLRETYSELPLVLGDPNQLKQVFLNIMNNAFDSLSDSRGEIVLSTIHKDNYAIIEVEDTGHGISNEDLPRIFEPFFTTKKEKGTGLGLSISYKIIQSHNGKLEVKSKQNEGSIFSISLPIIQKSQKQLVEPTRTSPFAN